MDIEETKSNNIVTIRDPEEFLMNITASCLLKEMRYYDKKEDRVVQLLNALVRVCEKNPEFVLQLALYVRNELYIRTTTNFLVAFASLKNETKPFLSKYFNKTVLIPKDLIEVCQFVQVLRYSKNNNFQNYDLDTLNHIDFRSNMKMPSCLKIAIAEKFPEFKEFQLGKACSDSNRKKVLQRYKWFFNPELYQKSKKIAKEKKMKKLGKEIENLAQNQNSRGGRGGRRGGRGGRKAFRMKEAKEVIAQSIFDLQFLTMKDIILKSHIKSPQYLIRKILGVKYPSSVDEFEEIFKEDIKIDPSLQFDGKLSGDRMKLDIPLTWETELSAKGNTPEIWTELINSNKIGYLALLRNLRNILKVELEDSIHQKAIQYLKNEHKIKNSKIFPLQYFSAMEIVNQFKMPENYHLNEGQLSNLKSQYIDALNHAINVSVSSNLEEIPGKTVIFVDVSASLRISISGGKKYGSINQSLDLALILGIMIKTKAKDCDFIIFSSAGENKDGYIKVENLTGLFLQDMEKLKEEINSLGGGTVFPHKLLREYIEKGYKMDSLIVISDMMIDTASKAKTIKNLDLAFVIDTTGSMGPYIQKAKDAIIQVTEKLDLITESNNVNARYGVVAYRDHPPQDNTYVTQKCPFTNAGKSCEFIQKLSAGGGGDMPEAVFDGLHDALNFKWKGGEETKRVILHVCDAPPHGTKYSNCSSFPKGCPCKIDETKIASLMKIHNVDYKFLKICSSTNEMEKIFEDVFPNYQMQQITNDLPMNLLSEEMVLNDIGSQEISRMTTEYVEKVNPDLKIFSIDIGGYNKAFDFGQAMNEKNLIKIMGTSDNILKFIALRGSVSQVEAVKLFAAELLAKK